MTRITNYQQYLYFHVFVCLLQQTPKHRRTLKTNHKIIMPAFKFINQISTHVDHTRGFLKKCKKTLFGFLFLYDSDQQYSILKCHSILESFISFNGHNCAPRQGLKAWLGTFTRIKENM